MFYSLEVKLPYLTIFLFHNMLSLLGKPKFSVYKMFCLLEVKLQYFKKFLFHNMLSLLEKPNFCVSQPAYSNPLNILLLNWNFQSWFCKEVSICITLDMQWKEAILYQPKPTEWNNSEIPNKFQQIISSVSSFVFWPGPWWLFFGWLEQKQLISHLYLGLLYVVLQHCP